MKTSELIGPALDWAVAKCTWGNTYPNNFDLLQIAKVHKYSTDWSQGGPIIAQNWKEISAVALRWMIQNGCEPNDSDLLIFWMRCFVASKLGDEIEIPEELK
jgi:hypothetical protein